MGVSDGQEKKKRRASPLVDIAPRVSLAVVSWTSDVLYKNGELL